MPIYGYGPNNLIRLELDPTGTNPDNKIIDEPHTLSNNKVRSIAPRFTPFFAESVIVRDGANVLKRGIDYQIVELHQEATLKYGKEISSVILIINKNVSNEVYVTYQSLGGYYTYDNTAIENLYESVINDNRPIDWENVLNKPDAYPPTIHRHLLEDLYGFEPVVDYLERIKRAITLGQADILLELVNRLLPAEFSCGKDLAKVIPEDTMIRKDALMYLFSKYKIISNISIEPTQCIWYKGDSWLLELDISSYNGAGDFFIEFYSPEGEIVSIRANGSFFINANNKNKIYIPVYVETTDQFPYPIYVGVKKDPNDDEFIALSYKITIKDGISTDIFSPLYFTLSSDSTGIELDLYHLDEDDFLRPWVIAGYDD